MKYVTTKYEGIYKYKTKSGDRYRVRLVYEQAGKRAEHSKQGFRTLQEARAYKADVEPKLYTGQSLLVLGTHRTLKDQWEDYYETKVKGKKWNNHTTDTNLWRASVWLDRFGNKPMVDLTRNDIQNFVYELYEQNDYSQESMKNFYRMLMQIIDDAVEDGYLERNRLKKISYEKPGGGERKEKVLPLDTYLEFMKLAKKHLRSDIYLCLYLTTYGLRRGEVYGIKKNSIHFLNNGLARIDINCARTSKYPEGKSVKSRDSKRLIVVDEETTSMLKEQLKFAKKIKAKHDSILHEDDFIFLTPVTGNPYYIKLLNDYMQVIAQIIDPELVVTPHMFRHTFATYASASGVDSLQLRRFMGHSDVEMTSHYTGGSELGAENVMRLTQGFRKLNE